MTEVNYTVELEQEEDGRWLADVVSLPGCIAYGATRDEALTRARQLAEMVVADLRSAGETLPRDADIAHITLKVA